MELFNRAWNDGKNGNEGSDEEYAHRSSVSRRSVSSTRRSSLKIAPQVEEVPEPAEPYCCKYCCFQENPWNQLPMISDKVPFIGSIQRADSRLIAVFVILGGLAVLLFNIVILFQSLQDAYTNPSVSVSKILRDSLSPSLRICPNLVENSNDAMMLSVLQGTSSLDPSSRVTLMNLDPGLPLTFQQAATIGGYVDNSTYDDSGYQFAQTFSVNGVNSTFKCQILNLGDHRARLIDTSASMVFYSIAAYSKTYLATQVDGEQWVTDPPVNFFLSVFPSEKYTWDTLKSLQFNNLPISVFASGGIYQLSLTQNRRVYLEGHSELDFTIAAYMLKQTTANSTFGATYLGLDPKDYDVFITQLYIRPDTLYETLDREVASYTTSNFLSDFGGMMSLAVTILSLCFPAKRNSIRKICCAHIPCCCCFQDEENEIEADQLEENDVPLEIIPKSSSEAILPATSVPSDQVNNEK